MRGQYRQHMQSNMRRRDFVACCVLWVPSICPSVCAFGPYCVLWSQSRPWCFDINYRCNTHLPTFTLQRQRQAEHRQHSLKHQHRQTAYICCLPLCSLLSLERVNEHRSVDLTCNSTTSRVLQCQTCRKRSRAYGSTAILRLSISSRATLRDSM